MDKFSAKDICDIIRTSSKYNVKLLQLGDLCVKFGEESPEVMDRANQEVSYAQMPHVPLEPYSLVTQEQQDVIRQLEENQLMIDDPIAYEQSIIDGYGKLPLSGELDA